MGGQPRAYPLGAAFFTQAPHRFGDHVAQLSLAPVSTSLVEEPLAPDRQNDPDAVRGA